MRRWVPHMRRTLESDTLFIDVTILKGLLYRHSQHLATGADIDHA